MNAYLDYECATTQLVAPDLNQISGMPEPSSTVCGAALLSLGVKPGAPLLLALMQGGRAGIGSQIALRMSLETAVRGPLDQATSAAGNTEGGAQAIELVRTAFREANRTVYEYAHRMAQGGNVSATGLVGAYDGSKFGVGVVGDHLSLIIRQGRALSFLDQARNDSSERVGALERFIGANAKILVELAATDLKLGDLVILSNLPFRAWLLELSQEVAKLDLPLASTCRRFAQEALRQQEGGLTKGGEKVLRNIMVFMLRVGSPTISLSAEQVVDS